MELASALCFNNLCSLLPLPAPSSSAPSVPPQPRDLLGSPSLKLRPRRRSAAVCPPCCGKMFVPGFGEASPEAKAAQHLQNFFTFLAVKIVLAQLQSYNPEAYGELMEFLDKNSLNNGDKFCRALMRESSRHKALALRILEVRSAYCKNDFEWDNMKKLAFKVVDDSNTKLMRDYVLETSDIDEES